MKLTEINKTRYRKHLNIIIVAFIAVFMVLALIFGQALIAMFAQTSTNVESNNFRYNLAGVILALLACAVILSQFRSKPFFTEVYYVWQLKQIINQIYRKLSVIKKVINNSEHKHYLSALTVLYYYYKASQQLYLLDDNTITLSSINKELDRVEEKISILNQVISTDDFNKEMLVSFKAEQV
ncbi:MAG: DUF3087 domain-containing protein [Alteromonadaceae bacterium]|nr:DUF3087 domain-containing protein [Alteromonadaceae bacterium]